MNSQIVSSNKKFPLAIYLALASLLFVLAAIAVFLFGNPTVALDLQLDGKPLPLGVIPVVTMNGKPFHSGDKVSVGHNSLSIVLNNAEPINRNVWTFWGANDLGSISLITFKGNLKLTITPSATTFELRQGADSIRSGIAPTTLSDVPVGDYELLVSCGSYKESKSVTIAKGENAPLNIILQLANIVLESSPTDADYLLLCKGGVDNGVKWPGKLPTVISNVPFGTYDCTISRKGWDIGSSITIDKAGVITNLTEFPYGSIEVTSEPTGLTVSTNGVGIGKTPITLQELKPASYNLTISDGENDLAADVNVGPKENAKHDFVFRYGTVQLMSTPVGASVIRKGKEIGKTPLTLDRVPIGELSIGFNLDGYVGTNLVVSVTENAVTNFTVKLISEQYLQSMSQARAAFHTNQFEQAQKFLATALEIETNDPATMELQSEVSNAVTKAEEARTEAERDAAIVRKKAERQEVVGIIEKAISAEGGREAINRFLSFKEVSRSSGKKNGVDFTMHMTTYVQLPDKIRLDQEVANQPKKIGPITITTNGGKPEKSIFCITENGSWEVIPTILGPIQQAAPQNIQNLFRAALYTTECTTLIPLLGSDYALEKLPDSPSTPDNTVAIKVHKAGKSDITLFFDKDSGLLVRLDSEGTDESGSTLQESERYSEYRSFSGLMCPTISILVREGNTSSEEDVESIEPLNQYYGNVFNGPPSQQ